MLAFKALMIVLCQYAFYMIAKKALSMTPGSPETEKLMEALNDIYMGIGLIYVNFPGTRFRKALQVAS